jgi:hypothetical protein
MNTPTESERIRCLREFKPRKWKTLSIETKREMLAATLNVDQDSLKRAYKLAKKHDLPKKAESEMAQKAG